MSGATFPKSARLLRPSEFNTALRGKRIGRGAFFMLSRYIHYSSPDSTARLGLIIAKRNAQRVANELGIDEVHAEVLPEDKAAYVKQAKAEVEQLSAKLNAIQAASKANDIEEINGVKVLYVEEQLENAKAKQLTFDFRDQLESGIVVLVSKYEEKCSYFVSVSKDLVGQYKAGNIIKAINEVVDGRGGGKPDFAQGGCAINDNISKIKGALKNIL